MPDHIALQNTTAAKREPQKPPAFDPDAAIVEERVVQHAFSQLLTIAPLGENFEGRAMPSQGTRIFGGHTLAHSLVAAMKFAGNDRLPDSLHAVFVGPGDSDRPVTYTPRILKRGRNIDIIAIDGSQGDRAISTVVVTSQSDESSFSFQPEKPDVPGPALLSIDPAVRSSEGRVLRHPFELRTVLATSSEPKTDTWIRWRGSPSVVTTQGSRSALLAFALDFLITSPARTALGSAGKSAVGASLDHAMWFHRDAPIDQWLLVSSRCLSLTNSRALCASSVFTESGTLVATATQEMLLRQAPVQEVK